MRLITFDLATGHLRRTIAASSPPSPEETDLRLKIEQAEEIVIGYVNQRLIDGDIWAASVEAWDVASETYPPPARVQAAVLVQLSELDRFRGDDVMGEPMRDAGMTIHPRAAGYLYPLRDPAMA
jgi:hypothetical protein